MSEKISNKILLSRKRSRSMETIERIQMIEERQEKVNSLCDFKRNSRDGFGTWKLQQ
jgi:N6-adenosine-specific RNA methylase IME4